jgi:hypothetical protein
MATKSVRNCSGSLFLAVNDQDVIKICCNNCNKLRQELQETLEELKSVRLINNILQSEINATHIAENVSTNDAHSVDGVNHDERGSGTDKNRWIQVVKASRRQNYPQIGERTTTSNRFASLQYLQESDVRHHSNDLITSNISKGKESTDVITTQT